MLMDWGRAEVVGELYVAPRRVIDNSRNLSWNLVRVSPPWISRWNKHNYTYDDEAIMIPRGTMNRCTKACAGQLRQPRLTNDGQKRCISYDRSKHSREQILQQIQSEIIRIEGRKNSIDLKKKTIETETGELPLSPILDPEWVISKRRLRKPEAGKMSGQFRRQLSNNPYGM